MTNIVITKDSIFSNSGGNTAVQILYRKVSVNNVTWTTVRHLIVQVQQYGFFWRWQRHHVYVQWKILALRYVNLVVHRHFPFLFHFPFITLNISLTQICNKINVYDKKKSLQGLLIA